MASSQTDFTRLMKVLFFSRPAQPCQVSLLDSLLDSKRTLMKAHLNTKVSLSVSVYLDPNKLTLTVCKMADNETGEAWILSIMRQAVSRAF